MPSGLKPQVVQLLEFSRLVATDGLIAIVSYAEELRTVIGCWKFTMMSCEVFASSQLVVSNGNSCSVREVAESMVFALQIPLHPWVSPTEVYRFSPEEWANLLLYYDAVVSSLKPLRTDEGSVMFCAVCMRYITLSSPQSHSGDRHSCCVSCRATFLRMRLN
jgi:hypothetical protein